LFNISYIDTENNTRLKYYNKFICQLTSGGTTKTIGSHIYDFLYCPDNRLNSTFKNEKGIEHGITRAEATIYGGYLPTKKQLEDRINTMFKNVDIPMFYKTPLKEQWSALTEQLENNLIVYNKEENALHVALYGNSLTRKLTATTVKLQKYDEEGKNKLINYAKAHYSIKCLPCYYVELEKKENTIIINMEEVFKTVGQTQIFKNNILFTNIPKEGKETESIKKAGLESPYIELFLPDTKQQIKSKILFSIETKPTTKEPSTLSFYKREQLLRKLQEEEIYNNTTQINNLEKQKRLEELNKIRIRIEANNKIIGDLDNKKQELLNLFSGRAKSELQMELNKTYLINAFRITKNNYLIINCIEEETEINCAYFVPEYLQILLKNNLHAFVEYGDGYYALDNINNYFYKFTAIHTYYSDKDKHRHIFIKPLECRLVLEDPNIKNVLEDKKELENAEQKLKMQDIVESFKVKDLARLETLQNETNYNITHLKEVEYRGKKRFAIKFKEFADTIFISNFWLNKEILSKGKPNNITQLKTLKEKTTPHKIKEMFVVI